MSYLTEDFLLTTKTAKHLYQNFASTMPIIDYHCHLPEKQILENKPFKDIFEVWLAGDHYKWRLMRNFGIDEKFITGDATNKEKFVCYCTALESAFGNPLYHWSQVELKEFFNCELEINQKNADLIWDWCNEFIKINNITPQKLIEQSSVTHVFTTNEIFDDLSTFTEIAKKDYKFKVIPAFRADKIMNIEADGYLGFLQKLGEVKDLSTLEEKIEERLKEFIKVGTTAADIALQNVYTVSDFESADEVFKRRVNGEQITETDAKIFKGYLTYFLFKLYAKYDVATELHLGAMRNNNTKMLQILGLDTGYDSIAEDNSTANLSRLFDRLHSENSLPKTVLFNLNPKMNAELMTLLGCFQSSQAKGKIQYGPAWWFLDNKVGMEKHLDDLTATGHIGTFVGMLTDSRSFLSYPRHHYFRRILCSFLGEKIEKGEMTKDLELVGKVIKDICYNNAIAYFKCN